VTVQAPGFENGRCCYVPIPVFASAIVLKPFILDFMLVEPNDKGTVLSNIVQRHELVTKMQVDSRITADK
jgi:hypothetical protein